MRNKNLVFTTLLAIGISAASSCMQSEVKNEKAKELTKEEKIERGKYLVNVIGCDDCHSPKKFGPQGPEVIEELRFSGYPSSRPIAKPDTNQIKQGWSLFGEDFTNTAGMWGMSFAANLTSDPTGIGNWTEDQFVYAIRNGKLKGMPGSRDLLPPMPWFQYKNMTDEDLKSIFAFLQTTKPVQNVVPSPRQIADIP